jgi:hypothetical protein
MTFLFSRSVTGHDSANIRLERLAKGAAPSAMTPALIRPRPETARPASLTGANGGPVRAQGSRPAGRGQVRRLILRPATV